MVFIRKCPKCKQDINYINIRSYNLANKNNTKCIVCRSNNGNFRYTCECGNVLNYKRESDYKKALKNKIKCSNCHKKNYVIKNKQKVLKSKRKWNKNNKKYYQDKRNNDLNYKIGQLIRIRIIKALKNNWKKGHTIELLGCSIIELRKYLESKFDDNMTWDNYGKYWEIDHIIPCASFDLYKVKNQKECFNYKNLQPLEKTLNRKKGSKL